MKTFFLLLSFIFVIFFASADTTQGVNIDLKSSALEFDKPQTYNELGYENLKTNPALSLELAHKALELAEKLNDEQEAINALLLMGIVRKNLGRFDEAAAHYFKALRLATKLNLKDKQSVCLNNIGSLYQTQQNYQKALTYFKQSLDIERQLNNKAQVSIRLYNLGVVYETMDSLDLAYTFYFNSLLIEQELGNKEGEFYALYGIAGIENKKKYPDKAKTSIFTALQIAKTLDDANGISLCYSELGALLKTTSDLIGAMAAYDSSVVYAQKVQQNNTLMMVYKELSNLHALMGRYREALSYLKLYTSLNDSINTAEINSKVAEIDAAHQIEKWENEVKHLKEKAALNERSVRAEKRNRYFLLLAFVLSLFIAISNLKRVIQDKRNIILYTAATVLLLILIAYFVVLAGLYDEIENTYRLFYAIADVLSIAVLPIITIVLLTERVMLSRNIKTAESLSTHLNAFKTEITNKPLSFVDEGERNRFEVMLNDLVCIEANDNYSAFYFYKNAKIEKILFRITLKSVETQLLENEDVMRCHKSYIVNLKHITHVSGNAQGYKLHFADLKFEIPVSRKFPKDIFLKIKKNSFIPI